MHMLQETSNLPIARGLKKKLDEDDEDSEQKTAWPWPLHSVSETSIEERKSAQKETDVKWQSFALNKVQQKAAKLSPEQSNYHLHHLAWTKPVQKAVSRNT